ncbi:MAG TPA: hypothetical protein VLB69_06135 [Rudaea sp.]|nr:hypothetical protein [Rudaea sp.]
MNDAAAEEHHAIHRRKTASDRPGVAQPVPKRPVPEQPWNRIFVGMLMLLALMLGAWEWYWRDFGATPGIRNTHGLWAIQRRRIDAGAGDATVIVGSSRVFFDIQLDVWEQLDGKRPIQLAFEGTTPLPFVEDLAADPKFTGRLLIGVAPELFFSGHGRYHIGALKYWRDESPSQRVGQWLSMHLVEPFVAFYDPDYTLAAVLKRQPWPDRPGKPAQLDVRKLSVTAADRDTHMWSKVENDPVYRALMRKVWEQDFKPSEDDPKPEELAKMRDEQIERMVKAVATLRARGVKVLFVRAPSTGPYLEFDNHLFPRATSWDVLLAKTGAPGIHFEDYPELQGLDQPEWSHLSHADAKKFTASLHAIIVRGFWKPDPPSNIAR